MRDDPRDRFHIEIKCSRLGSRLSKRAHGAEGLIEIVAEQNEGFRSSEKIS